MRRIGFKSVFIFVIFSLLFACSVSAGNSQVYVTVNGMKITDDHVKALIEKDIQNAISLGRPPSREMQHNMKVRAIDELIEKVLIDERIKAKKIKVTIDEVDKEVEKIAKSKGMTVDQFLSSTYRSYNLDAREFRDRVAMGLRFDKLIELEAGPKAFQVTDIEARRFYELHKKKEFVKPAMVRASHIMIKYPERSKTAKSDVKYAMTKLMEWAKNGKDFAALARKYSEDKVTSKKGGDLDFFTKEYLPPKLAEVAFSLKKGEVSDVIEMPYGCHLIKVFEIDKGGVDDYEKVKDRIYVWLRNDKKDDFAKKYVKGLLDGARIKWAGGKRPELIPIREETGYEWTDEDEREFNRR